MRNLKRALSLTLASVMLLGMMVVGSSAASFPDVDDNDNIEAIDVLETVKVMVGNENGDFEPDKNVTRAEMAVVMAELLNLDYDYYVTSCPFNDVPDWAKGYVGACAANGIVSGRGEGVYDPSATVTAVEAASMMMRALGYFQNSGDYKGGFEAATVRQASEIGLFAGIGGNAKDPLNRNQVAKLALNTLEANMVYFTGDMGFEANGISIGYRSEYSIRKGTDPKYRAISSLGDTTQLQGGGAQGQYYINLGEELYDGKLTKDSSATDDFARFATEWRYKGERIGIYADDADLTYTKAVKIGDIYKDLHLNRTIPARDVEVFVDGVRGGTIDGTPQTDRDIKSGDNTNKYGGNGVLTQVYYYTNVDNVDIVRITEVNTWTGTVIRNVDAKDTKNAYVLVAPESAAQPAGTSGNLEFETDEKYEDDARILYTYSQSADAIVDLAVAESVSGTATKTENSNTDQADRKALTLDETRYECSVQNAGERIEENMLDNEYTVYLDFYGYMIYIDEVDVGIGNYALLVNTASSSTFLGNRARLILADGTVKNVVTTKNYNDGDDEIKNYTIVTFRENSDHEFTLRAVPAANSYMNAARTTSAKNTNAQLDNSSTPNDYAKLILETNKANITVDTGAVGYKADGTDNGALPATTTNTFRANSASTFIVADKGDDGNDSDFTAYTGIKNAPTVKSVVDAGGTAADDHNKDNGVAAYWYCKNDNMITVMFVFPEVNAEVKGASTKLLYVAKDSVSNLISDKNGSQYFLYNAIVGGEIVTEKVAVDSEVKVDNTTNAGSVAMFPTTVGGGADKNYASQSAATKGQMGGIFQSYSADKDGIVTEVKNYKTYTVGNDEELLVGTGIDKRNKEYTVILNTVGSSQTITVADAAKIYYVTDKGDINEWSYNRIAVDENDKVYAVVKDGMVQTLIIEEVKPAPNTYSVTFTAAADLATKVESSVTLTSGITGITEGNSATFTLTPKKGITIESVTADRADVVKSGNSYTINSVTRDLVVTVVTSGTVTEEAKLDLTVNVTARVTIGTDRHDVTEAGIVVNKGATDVTINWGTTPAAGKVVLLDGEPLAAFSTNGSTSEYTITISDTETHTLVIGLATQKLTLPDADWTVGWAADATKGIEEHTPAAVGSTKVIDVPVSVTVTVAPKAADKAATHYLYNPAGDATKTDKTGQMVSNANFEFTMPDEAVTITADKYHKVDTDVTLTAKTGTGAPAMGDSTLSATLAVTAGKTSQTVNDLLYVKEGDTVDVTFALTTTDGGTAYASDLYAYVSAPAGTTNGFGTNAAAVKIVDTGNLAAVTDKTITIGAGTLDYAFTFTYGDQAALNA